MKRIVLLETQIKNKPNISREAKLPLTHVLLIHGVVRPAT